MDAHAHLSEDRHVLLLKPGGKTPLPGQECCPGSPHVHGWKDATPDERVLNLWMLNHQDANYGVVTGGRLIVLDSDTPDGEEALAQMEAEGELPATYTVRTASRGFHRYYLTTSPVPNVGGSSAKGPVWREGVDVKGSAKDGGLGGYVVAEGSRVVGDDGTETVYTAVSDAPIATLPEAVADSIREVAQSRSEPVSADHGEDDPSHPEYGSQRAQGYARKGLEDEVAELLAMPYASHWEPSVNTAALKIGGYVNPAWGLTYHEAQTTFVDALVSGGWTREKAVKNVDHGLLDGQASPHPLSKMGAQPHEGLAFNHDEEEAFWTSRPSLEAVRQMARARLAAPWATLGVVLARALTATKPCYVLPPTIGGEASLNLFVGLVAGSSGGKGAAMAAAKGVLPDPMEGDPFPTFGVSSGEGLVHQYMEYHAGRKAAKEREEEPPRWEQYQEECLHTAGEVDKLAAVSKRDASTLMPVLRELYMGEEVSFSNASMDKRRKLEEHTYRACLVVGIQPARAEALFGKEAEGGTTQRFLWLPATDPDAREGVQDPGPLEWKRPTTHPPITPDGFHVLKVCPEAVAETKRIRLERMRGQVDDLQGHRNLTRTKVAVGLSILDGRMEVSSEDWKLSEYVMRVSDHELAQVQAVLAEKNKAANVQRGRDYAAREVVKEETIANAATERVAARLLAKLQGGETWKWSGLYRSTAHRDRGYFQDAIEQLGGAVHLDGSDEGRTLRLIR